MNYGAGSGIGGGPGGGLGGGGLGGAGAFGPPSMGGKEDPVRSTHSLNKPAETQSLASTGNRVAGGGPQTGATGYTEPSASAPLMTGSSGEPPQSEPYAYRAKALYNCELLLKKRSIVVTQIHRYRVA